MIERESFSKLLQSLQTMFLFKYENVTIGQYKLFSIFDVFTNEFGSKYGSTIRLQFFVDTVSGPMLTLVQY